MQKLGVADVQLTNMQVSHFSNSFVRFCDEPWINKPLLKGPRVLSTSRSRADPLRCQETDQTFPDTGTCLLLIKDNHSCILTIWQLILQGDPSQWLLHIGWCHLPGPWYRCLLWRASKLSTCSRCFDQLTDNISGSVLNSRILTGVSHLQAAFEEARGYSRSEV